MDCYPAMYDKMHALCKLRASSHTLEIERGRHNNPKTPIENRLCLACNSLEDEEHFLLSCSLFEADRANLFNKVEYKYPDFIHMENKNRFAFLLYNQDSQVLTWVGKFIYRSFEKRSEFHLAAHNNRGA